MKSKILISARSFVISCAINFSKFCLIIKKLQSSLEKQFTGMQEKSYFEKANKTNQLLDESKNFVWGLIVEVLTEYTGRVPHRILLMKPMRQNHTRTSRFWVWQACTDNLFRAFYPQIFPDLAILNPFVGLGLFSCKLEKRATIFENYWSIIIFLLWYVHIENWTF